MAAEVGFPSGLFPKHFRLKADGTHTPCHVSWCQAQRIGVAFDQDWIVEAALNLSGIIRGRATII